MTNEFPAPRTEDIDPVSLAGGSPALFPPALERAYREHMIDARHRPVIAHWLIGIALYDAFLVSDYLVARNDILVYLVGRLICMTPVSLLALAVAFRFRRTYEYAICVPALAMSAALSVMILKSHGTFRANYLFGDILLMMCGSVITQSRLRFACCTILIQITFFTITLFEGDVVSAMSLPVSMSFCLSGAVLSLLTAQALEQSSRSTFLMTARINRLNRELDAAANTDPLTGLANRRCLARAVERLWAQDRAPAVTVSLILIDVDRFKLFNDSYGHPAGDRCLATIARQVSSNVRAGNALAVRFGGEELLVMLPDCNLPAAQQVAENIRLAIINAAVPHPALAQGAVVTVSLGVATAKTRECSSLELTARADSALYAAKAAGRNRIWPPLEQREDVDRCLYDPPSRHPMRSSCAVVPPPQSLPDHLRTLWTQPSARHDNDRDCGCGRTWNSTTSLYSSSLMGRTSPI